jgi:hypothetical protein
MIVLSLQSHRKTLNNEPDSDHISLNGRLSNVTRGEVDKTGPIVFFCLLSNYSDVCGGEIRLEKIDETPKICVLRSGR